MASIVLYQPDIPQNTGALLRLCACMGLGLELIEPCGFPLDDRKLKRVAMDYTAPLMRHASWNEFRQATREAGERVLLLTTKTDTPYTQVTFKHGDKLLFGRESAGVPEDVASMCDLKLTVPMVNGARSLNVAMTAAMVAGEVRRQVMFP